MVKHHQDRLAHVAVATNEALSTIPALSQGADERKSVIDTLESRLLEGKSAIQMLLDNSKELKERSFLTLHDSSLAELRSELALRQENNSTELLELQGRLEQARSDLNDTSEAQVKEAEKVKEKLQGEISVIREKVRKVLEMKHDELETMTECFRQIREEYILKDQELDIFRQHVVRSNNQFTK